MKKKGWPVLLTVALALVFLFCLYVRQRSAPEKKPLSFLSFRICSNETPDVFEEVLCWNQDDERCFVFLPSYADLSRTEVRLRDSRECRLEGIRLTPGLNCGIFSPDTDYELTGEGFSPKMLRFVQSANAAAMYIDMLPGSLDRVYADKSRRERASITLYTADGKLDYDQGMKDLIRGHGNSTWYQQKKSYNLYLYSPASLLEMDSAADWVLISNAADNTDLRNKLIYDFADKVSPRPGWAPASEYVDLFINGEYAGLYLLCEKAKIVADRFKEKKDERVTICLNNHITKLDHPDTALKLDNDIYAEIVAPSVPSAAGYTRLEAFLHEFMNALPGENWNNYIDLDSFARKYLLEEIFANTDGGEASQYCYWDPSANRLYAGPCWDYDLTLGDSTWVDWISPYCLKMQDALWYKDLWTHEDFAEYVRKLYRSEFVPLLNQLLEDLPAAEKRMGKAINANHIRWTALYENGQDSMAVLQFLSDRVRFLNSLWVDRAEYCEISFDALGPKGLPLLSLFVPVNSLGSVIPSPQDMGMAEGSVWYLAGSDEPFDYASVISEDLTLYLKGEPAANEDTARLSVSSVITLFILVLSVVTFLLLIPALLFIEYRQNRSGRRHGHE